MSDHSNLIMEIVSRICTADSNAEALDIFKIVMPIMTEFRFVLEAEIDSSVGVPANKTFKHGAVVRSLFRSNKVIFLDFKTVSDMSYGSTFIPVERTISLDTQAMSHLEPYSLGGTPDQDMAEVFEFIANPNVDVNPAPYMYENLQNLNDESNHVSILMKLRGYERLRNLDLEYFERTGKIRSTLSESDLKKKAGELMEGMFRWRAEGIVPAAMTFRYQTMYAQLLKMACIQLRGKSQNAERKFQEFIEFCDSKLATLMIRTMLLSKTYFSIGQSMRFFKRVQKRRADIFLELQAMAWDLVHIFNMEEMLTFTLDQKARYLIPAFLTFDKGLIEVIDLYPLKSVAISGNTPHPFYSQEVYEQITGNGNNRNEFVQRLYSEEFTQSRNERRPIAKASLSELIDVLESELRRIACVA